ncbi:hypothetical protein SLE2022_304770 [Rubroshorea leprosula]
MKFQFTVQDGCNIYLNDFDDGTGSISGVDPKQRNSGEEDDDAAENSDGGDSKPRIPSSLILDPHDESQTDSTADAEGEEEPIEKARHLSGLFWALLVKLIGSVGWKGGFEPRRPSGQQLQCHKEECGISGFEFSTLRGFFEDVTERRP